MESHQDPRCRTFCVTVRKSNDGHHSPKAWAAVLWLVGWTPSPAGFRCPHNRPNSANRELGNLRQTVKRLTVSEIVEQTNANRNTIKVRLRELVISSHLIQHGKARATWYSKPKNWFGYQEGVEHWRCLPTNMKSDLLHPTLKNYPKGSKNIPLARILPTYPWANLTEKLPPRPEKHPWSDFIMVFVIYRENVIASLNRITIRLYYR